MGTIFKDEPIVGPDSELYICTTRTRRRRIGHLEPWGGRDVVPVRSVASRRNPESIWTSCGASTSPTERCAGTPVDQKLYTPIKEAAVTLYEPHNPHLSPLSTSIYER